LGVSTPIRGAEATPRAGGGGGGGGGGGSGASLTFDSGLEGLVCGDNLGTGAHAAEGQAHEEERRGPHGGLRWLLETCGGGRVP
jgi:hypothetical protein